MARMIASLAMTEVIEVIEIKKIKAGEIMNSMNSMSTLNLFVETFLKSLLAIGWGAAFLFPVVLLLAG